MGLIVFDPTSGPSVKESRMAKRGKSLDDSIIGLIDNGKANSDVVLELIIQKLKKTYKIKDSIIHRKGSFSHAIKESEARVLAEKCDFIISGIGD